MSAISLSMIVKNESEYLAECLESVKDIVNEIIVVDTGSEDETVEIAHAHGAKVYHYKWNNDFSGARNFALSKSNNDWVLYLDADERLDENSKDELKKLTSTNIRAGIRCKIFNIDEVNKKPKLQSSTRLFKNSKGIEFRGRAHEQIDDSLVEKGYKIINSDLLINHVGYNIDKSGLRKKAKRNLTLLLEDYKNNPVGYIAFQIANSYSILNQKEKAYQYYESAVNDYNLAFEYKAYSLSNIAEYRMQYGDAAGAVDAINNAVKIDPANIISNLTASDIYFKINKGDLAVDFCIKAFEDNNKGPDPKINRLLDVFIDPERIIYHGLTIAFSTNQPSGIEYFFNALEKAKSKDTDLWQGELKLIQLISEGKILTTVDIESAVQIINEDNLDFYLGILKNYNNNLVKLTIDERLSVKFPDNVKVRNRFAYDLSKKGETDEAIKLLESKLSEFPEDVTQIFYLISLYMEKKEMLKLENLVSSSKTKFSCNPVFMKHINEIESIINPYKLNNNLIREE